MKSLVVVESPAKAKTINKYLGKDYTVLASFGHIRQLPKENGSVDPDNNFHIKYEIDRASQKHVKALVDAMNGCDKLILASDPDREGEAIAWHVAEVLKQKKAIKKDTVVERVVFNAITKATVEKAMTEARNIDMDLVNAQQARVALDYLVGFTLSPVLWRKLPGSRSAGRVQSVALRLVCERQEEILNFVSEEYWSVDVNVTNGEKKDIIAKLVEINGKKIDKLFIKNEKQANDIKNELKNEKYTVKNIENKEIKRNPFAPFTTSTLQQEASKKLGFSTKKTMSIAQKLYEGVDVGDGSHGLITYMRTDGVYTAPEAIREVREYIHGKYGDKYLPKNAIIYQNKIKNAQEAHEAIRPTSPKTTPESIKKYLTDDEYKLYDLIWKRLIASQMSSVIMDQVSIDIATSKHLLRAVGSVIKFNGFYILYNETNEDVDDEKDLILPNVKIGEELNFKNVIIKQHFTEPPARYTEASLVKKMEELGIGRPSTYATIISVLQDRGYVKLEKKRFIAENRGIVVNAFLKTYFKKYVEYDYTARLEDDLDVVSNGKKNWLSLLNEFWVPFKKEIDKALEVKNADVLAEISKILNRFFFVKDKNGNINNKCPDCKTGTLGLKVGKFGVFIACSNYPSCKHTEQIASAGNEEVENNDNIGSKSKNKFEAKLLGQKDKLNVYLKKGPYGFYIQLGEDNGKPKPKRVGIPKNVSIDDVDFNKANALLELPRFVGKHPDDGEDIKANIGPYGPYLIWNKKFFSVKNDDILDITLNRALVVINEEINKKKNKK
ncbi:MAG: type I DNA topoisomerase [Rickettsiales bacterium]|nr:type I DNA topoisomerase [Rickettsiales bacterium]